MIVEYDGSGRAWSSTHDVRRKTCQTGRTRGRCSRRQQEDVSDGVDTWSSYTTAADRWVRRCGHTTTDGRRVRQGRHVIVEHDGSERAWSSIHDVSRKTCQTVWTRDRRTRRQKTSVMVDNDVRQKTCQTGWTRGRCTRRQQRDGSDSVDT